MSPERDPRSILWTIIRTLAFTLGKWGTDGLKQRDDMIRYEADTAGLRADYEGRG